MFDRLVWLTLADLTSVNQHLQWTYTRGLTAFSDGSDTKCDLFSNCFNCSFLAEWYIIHFQRWDENEFILALCTFFLFNQTTILTLSTAR